PCGRSAPYVLGDGLLHGPPGQGAREKRRGHSATDRSAGQKNAGHPPQPRAAKACSNQQTREQRQKKLGRASHRNGPEAGRGDALERNVAAGQALRGATKKVMASRSVVLP